MRLPKYTTEQLQEAVQTSTSMRQVLAKLSVAPYGGNYDVLRAKLKKHGLDTSHFLGQAWNRNRQLPPKTPLERYLEGARPIQSYKLKTAFSNTVCWHRSVSAVAFAAGWVKRS